MATMADVAKVANVSVSTVSHVINNTRAVSAETVARVTAAMEKTHYRRNILARALVTSKTSTIGLCISVFTNTFFGELVHAIETRTAEAGYQLFIADSHEDLAMENDLVSSFLGRRVEGLLVVPAPGADHTSLQAAVDQHTPVVLIDRNLEMNVDQVVSEGEMAAYRLTKHLIDNGHQDIAVMAGLDNLSTSKERFAGVERAIAQSHIPGLRTVLLRAESNQIKAARRVREAFSTTDHPTALVTLNNEMTIGAMRGLRSLGLSIPNDVAIVGYDDFEWADLFEPGLTTMGQDIQALAENAVDLLLARISGDDSPSQRVVIPTVFHHRKSCGCH